MKTPTTSSSSFRRAVAAAIGIACSITSASAQTTLTYDADTTAPANDGAGVWDTTTANWYTGTTDVVWSNGLTDTAIFGAAPAGTGGTVAVGTVNVGTIQFNPQTTTGYTLSGGTITLGTGITTTNTLNSTISSVIAGTNGLAFTGVAGASAVGVTLSGANTYTGITTLSTGGRITASNAAALGSNAGATASALGTNYTQVNTGTTVQVGNSTAEAFLINGQGAVASGNPPGALRIANGVTLSSLVQLGSNAQITSNFGTITISGNVDMGAFTLGVGNGSNGVNLLTISGVVTGGATGILDVGASGGSNVVNLTNTANTFSGTTRVNASSGTSSVGLGGDTVLGTSTVVFANGGIQSTNATARTIANTIGTFSGNAIFGQTTGGTGPLNFTYNTAAVSLGTTARTFTTNVDTAFAAGFSGTGGGITKAGAATLTLNGASTYTGATTINAGTLLVNGSVTGTGAVTVNNAASVLGGTGTLAGAVTVNTGGTLTGGTTTTTGNLAVGMLTLTSGSTLNLQVSSTAKDLITSNGTLVYGSAALTVGSIGGFALTSTSGSYDLLDATTFSGNLGSVTVDGNPLALSNNVWTGTAGNSNLSFDQGTGILAVTAVPEPATWVGAAVLTGLASLSRLKSRGGAAKRESRVDVSAMS